MGSKDPSGEMLRPSVVPWAECDSQEVVPPGRLAHRRFPSQQATHNGPKEMSHGMNLVGFLMVFLSADVLTD